MTFLNVKVPKVTLIVLLDLSVAFDPVQHETLLSHLRSRFWVDGKALDWFASFLADRSQCVVMNGGVLSTFLLKQGVPQGSCLGPILFTLYTSNLFDIVERHLPSVHCYANNSVVFGVQSKCPR